MFIGRFNSSLQYPKDYQDSHLEDLVTDENFYCCKTVEFKVYFFGMIYNRFELGYTSTDNNAEIVAKLYKNGGYNAFSSLDGTFTVMFYFADGTIAVIRDHHGTHSQVYYNDKYFASSLSLLRQTPDFSIEPNYSALGSFLTIGYIATPDSSFKNVFKLPAGHVLITKGNDCEVKVIFNTDNIEPVTSDKSLESLSEEYGYLHKEAIRRRIGDSHNVGILLSGGYDSGCNLAALRSFYGGSIYSYSIGFKGDNWTELPLARCMSETFQTVHQEYEINGSEIMNLPKIVEYLGDPFVEGGIMVNYAAMSMIGDSKPDIILGGDGSDQYFGTSGREVALHYLAAKYGVKLILNCIYKILNRAPFEKNIKPYRVRFHLDKILHILDGDLFGFPTFLLKDLILSEDFMSISHSLIPDLRSFEHLYTQHTYKSDIEKIINQVILFKASKMASMFGNHIAFPYMDTTLYQFLQRLPVEYKCRGNSVTEIARGHAVAKFLLKYRYKPILPEVITTKKKQGGFAPMPIFFKDAAQRAKLADFILSSSVTVDYLRKDKIEEFIRNYDKEATETGKWFWYNQNKAIQYFNLLSLSVWWEIFVKGEKNISF